MCNTLGYIALGFGGCACLPPRSTTIDGVIWRRPRRCWSSFASALPLYEPSQLDKIKLSSRYHKNARSWARSALGEVALGIAPSTPQSVPIFRRTFQRSVICHRNVCHSGKRLKFTAIEVRQIATPRVSLSLEIIREFTRWPSKMSLKSGLVGPALYIIEFSEYLRFIVSRCMTGLLKGISRSRNPWSADCL